MKRFGLTSFCSDRRSHWFCSSRYRVRLRSLTDKIEYGGANGYLRLFPQLLTKRVNVTRRMLILVIGFGEQGLERRTIGFGESRFQLRRHITKHPFEFGSMFFTQGKEVARAVVRL